MKLLTVLFAAFYISTSLANSCLLLTGVSSVAEVTALSSEIKDVTNPNFSKALCTAMNECFNYSEKLNELALQEKKIVKVPEIKAKISDKKEKLQFALKKLTGLDPSKPDELVDYLNIKVSVRTLTKSIELLERILLAQAAFEANPKKNKQPLNSFDDDELYSESVSKKLISNSLKEFEERKKKFQEAQVEVKKLDEKLAVKKSASPQDPYAITALEEDIKYKKSNLEIIANDLAAYEVFLKDPKNSDLPTTVGLNWIYDGVIYASDQVETKNEPPPSTDCDRALAEYENEQEELKNHSAGTCGLTPVELSVIHFYTSSGYQCMNNYLRKKKTEDSTLNILIDSLNSGLTKLPNFRGLVTRDVTLPESARAQHKVGSIINYSAFTSTTSGKSVFVGTDQFRIYSAEGKPIMGFSSSYEEYEVLFRSNTKFKVLKVASEDQEKVFVMKEITPGLSQAQEDKQDQEILALAEADAAKPKKDKSHTEWKCPVTPLPLSKKVKK